MLLHSNTVGPGKKPAVGPHISVPAVHGLFRDMESCRPCPFVHVYSPSVDFLQKAKRKLSTVLQLPGAKAMVQKIWFLAIISKCISKPLVSLRAVKC